MVPLEVVQAVVEVVVGITDLSRDLVKDAQVHPYHRLNRPLFLLFNLTTPPQTTRRYQGTMISIMALLPEVNITVSSIHVQVALIYLLSITFNC